MCHLICNIFIFMFRKHKLCANFKHFTLFYFFSYFRVCARAEWVENIWNRFPNLVSATSLSKEVTNMYTYIHTKRCTETNEYLKKALVVYGLYFKPIYIKKVLFVCIEFFGSDAYKYTYDKSKIKQLTQPPTKLNNDEC